MRVIITGAAGQIGRQLIRELSDTHELRLIDRVPVPQRKSVLTDLARNGASGRTSWGLWRKSWISSFEGADVVIHLAGDRRNDASWDCVLRDNIQVTWNVLDAAATHRVPRVVFASSNWAVKAVEKELAPSCYDPGGPKIGSETPPFSLTAYGLSKAFGELAGRMFVAEGKLESFVAVRIGNYNPTPSTDEVVRARWIGVEDIRSLFRQCVEVDLKGFHVVYAVSAQPSSPYDLSYSRDLLSWQPRQNAMSD